MSRIPIDYWAIALIVAVFSVAVFSFEFTYLWDDIIWTQVEFRTPWDVINFFYFEWGSRILSHVLVFLLVGHHAIWRVLTIMALVVVTVAPAVYVGKSPRSRATLLLLSLLLVSTIPATILLETGMIATTANYLFVIAAGFLAAYPLVAYLRGLRLRVPLVIISVLSLIYAANFEVMAFVLLAAFIAAIFFRRYRFQSFRGLIPFPAFALAAIIYHLTTPGNAVRLSMELVHFPGYTDLTLTRRIEIGWSTTLRSIFMNGYLAPFILALVVLLILIARRESLARVCVAAIPVFSWIAFSAQMSSYWQSHVSMEYGQRFTPVSTISARHNLHIPHFGPIFLPDAIAETFTGHGLVRIDNPASILIFLALNGVLLASVISIFWVYRLQSVNRPRVIAFVLFLACCSKAVIAFSPTIWVSGSRTDTFLIVGYLIAVLLLIEPFLDQEPGLAVRPISFVSSSDC